MTRTGDMAQPSRVEFRTLDGVTLRGDFFQAAGTGVPVVVMTQGLTLLKEHYIPDTARRFQAAGVSALLYDHRGYGSSDGFPRHQTNPAQQAEDYHDAVTAAGSLPGVDPARICVWGIGHSGGASMISVADDPRPAAVILNMPFISGAMDARGFPDGLLAAAWREREAATRAGSWQPSYVRVWPDSPENARGTGEQPLLRGEQPYAFITGGLARSEAAGTPWQNKITLQSFYHLARAEPRDLARKIKQRALYIAAVEDPLTATVEDHRAVFETMGPNATFAVVEPDHLATYFGEPFERSVAVQLEFLRRVFELG